MRRRRDHFLVTKFWHQAQNGPQSWREVAPPSLGQVPRLASSKERTFQLQSRTFRGGTVYGKPRHSRPSGKRRRSASSNDCNSRLPVFLAPPSFPSCLAPLLQLLPVLPFPPSLPPSLSMEHFPGETGGRVRFETVSGLVKMSLVS